MKLRNLLLILAAAAILAGQTADMGVTLERAIRKENVEGDLSGAIELYKKVVAASANRADVAKALLGLGECYEKQGSAEAQKSYERLVKEFGDQAEPARQAQARLAAMGKTREGEGVVAQLVTRDLGVDQSKNQESGDTEEWGRVTVDGKFYVFIDGGSGNLAVRDLQSGAARRLTKDATGIKAGDAHASSPVPSRDGKQIAYIWDPGANPINKLADEVRVINVDGSGIHTVPTKLGGHVPAPAVLDWTPDGKGLLIWDTVPKSTPVAAGMVVPAGIEPTGRGFSIVDLKTGAARPIVRSGGLKAILSQDGRWMIYSRRSAPSLKSSIFAVDTQTGEGKAIVAGPSVDRDAAWVPGTDRIVFRSDRKGTNGIWMVRFQDGSALGDPILLKADAGDYTPLGVSRDGSLFYGLSHQSSDIYSVEVDPRTLRAVGAPAVAVTSYPGRNRWPVWSPSGDAIAYYSNRESQEQIRMVILHAAGRETVVSTPFGHFTLPPQWCSANEIAKDDMVHRFDPNTGEVLPSPNLQHGLGLSPDCRFTYGFAQNSEGTRLSRIELSTGKETELVVYRASQAWPVVSPDERWLVFHGSLEGSTKHGLLLLSTEGAGLRDLDIDDMHDAGWSWTPDSKHVLVSRRVKRVNGQGPDSELYSISVEGGAPQSMGIRMNGLSAPSLNPDGKRLLFSSTETSNELWVLRNLPLK